MTGPSPRVERLEQKQLDGFTLPAGRSRPRQFVLTVATGAVRPLMSRRARRLLEASSAPRLHLGCANTILAGWLNVDLFGRQPTDAALDVTRPLPLTDESVDAIFAEHMVEHLTYEESFALARECARVLRVGGVLRFVVPDFERYARSYAEQDDFIETLGHDRLTPLLELASVAYGHSHRSIWDAATLISLLAHAGLDAKECQFGESRIRPCPDTKAREIESLYVEAVKDPSTRANVASRSARASPSRDSAADRSASVRPVARLVAKLSADSM